MSEQVFFNILLVSWFVLALVVFITLFFIAAPYGRHSRRGWGPTINNRLSWIVMEAPAPIAFFLLFVLGDNKITPTMLIFLTLWLVHYIHRAFVYPFGLQTSINRIPVFIIITAIFFNTVNGYLNGRYIFTFSSGYTNEWLTDPRFIAGLIFFITGFIINRQADNSLRRLRRSDECDYKISNSGLFRLISCPNYFGEIMIWSGWAVATWSLPGLAFAVWTFANLSPRAWAHHRWYQKYFTDYPPERKALIPKIW
jgi:protein-S-isoprenylcysteine O-methyltransferase Ste14